MISTGGSTISFENSTKPYHIPDTLLIDLPEIDDDTIGVYRVCIGKPDMTKEERQEYKRLFRVLDKRLKDGEGFVEEITFKVDGASLLFQVAYMTKRKTPYGVFYDIEATYDVALYEKEQNGTECIPEQSIANMDIGK